MMTTRRTFVKAAAAVAAGGLLRSAIAQSGSGGPSLNFGYISGIVREELKLDWRRVLSLTAEYGFKEIEIGNPPEGVSTEAFVAYCQQVGIKPVAGGVSMTEDEAALEERLSVLSALGARYAVAYWPWFVGDPFSLEDCRKSARTLNRMGEICRDRGLTLCWHNHDHEFETMEQGRPFDYLMEHTDERLVKCELDVYWVAKGGADPVETLRKYPGRYAILHLKDMTGDEQRTFECVGQGVIDFPVILNEARKQGIRHFIVEHDKVQDGLACLKSSARYLQGLKLQT